MTAKKRLEKILAALSREAMNHGVPCMCLVCEILLADANAERPAENDSPGGTI